MSGRKPPEELKGYEREDGVFEILVKPMTPWRNKWHEPHLIVPVEQWTPETGVTRYQWARDTTPDHQVPFFMEMHSEYEAGPPKPITEEIARRMREETITLPTGLPGYSEKTLRWLEEQRLELSFLSPDGCWRFTILAEPMGSGIVDRVLISHTDYRTLADWQLLMRARSWLFDDARDAMLFLPGQDTSREGWQNRYENGRPNCLQITCFRPQPVLHGNYRCHHCGHVVVMVEGNRDRNNPKDTCICPEGTPLLMTEDEE